MAITIPIVTDFDGRALKRAQKSFDQFGKEASKVGRSIKSAMMPAAVAVGALAAAGVSAVKAAIDDQKAQALLAKQVKTTTKATDAQIRTLEDWITTTSLATGVADDELRPALATLVRSTRSVTKAQKALRVALNVSRATGKPLVKVAESLARAYGGNVKALARLDPSLKTFITKTTTADQAVAKLAANFDGAANTAANTLSGRMDRLTVAFAEAREEIGYALLPLFESLVKVITDRVLPYVQKVTAAFSEGGLSAALRVVGTDLKHAMLNAEGFNGVLVNLAATAGVVFVAFKGFTFLSTVVGFLKAGAAASSALGTAFTTTAATLGAAFGIVLVTIYELISALRDPIFRSAFGEFLVNSAKLIANAFIGLYKIIRAAINPVIGLLQKIPGFGGKFGFLPDVNFAQFTFDAGSPQFTNPRQFESSPLSQMQGGPVTINVNGGDPNAVVDALRRYYRQSGPLPVAVQY